MKLETSRLMLKEITESDIPELFTLHTIPEVDEFNTVGLLKNEEETRQIHQCYFDDQKKQTRKLYCWIIRLKKDNQFVGVAGMSLSADRFKMGEIYYKLLPKHWGKGYATETGRALIQVGFDTLKLHRIEAGVATENHKSIKVLEKLGMTREGIRRKILPIRGEWVDNYHYAIVEDDPR